MYDALFCKVFYKKLGYFFNPWLINIVFYDVIYLTKAYAFALAYKSISSPHATQFETEIRELLKFLASAFVYQIEENIAYRLIYS